MAILSSPQPIFGAFFQCNEVGTAGSTGAGAPTDNVQVGTNQGGTQLSGGTTGTALSVNNKIDGTLALSALTPVTINLLSQGAGSFGTKTMSLVRYILITNNGAHNVEVYQAGSSGWANAPFPATPGITIPAGGVYAVSCPTVAGWAIGASAGSVTFDPGSNAGNISYVFAGE